jgi:hypothetical protein
MQHTSLLPSASRCVADRGSMRHERLGRGSTRARRALLRSDRREPPRCDAQGGADQRPPRAYPCACVALPRRTWHGRCLWRSHGCRTQGPEASQPHGPSRGHPSRQAVLVRGVQAGRATRARLCRARRARRRLLLRSNRVVERRGLSAAQRGLSAARRRMWRPSVVLQRWRVSAGGFHQLSWSPSMYCTGAATSSAGSRSSRQARLTET